jgi:hypothetical protein
MAQITLDTNNIPDVVYIVSHNLDVIAILIGVVLLGILASFILEYRKRSIKLKVAEDRLKVAVAKSLGIWSTILGSSGTIVALLQSGDLSLLNAVPKAAEATTAVASIAYFFYNLGGSKAVKSVVDTLTKWSKGSPAPTVTQNLAAEITADGATSISDVSSGADPIQEPNPDPSKYGL